MKPTLQSVMKEFDDLFDHWVYLSDIKTGCNWNSFKSGIKSVVLTLLASLLHSEMEGIIEETKKEIMEQLTGNQESSGYYLSGLSRMENGIRAKLNEKAEEIKSLNK